MIRMPGKKGEMMVRENGLTIKVLESEAVLDNDKKFSLRVMNDGTFPESNNFIVEAVTGKTISQQSHIDFEIAYSEDHRNAVIIIHGEE